jgi:hypothetical protein
MKKRGTLRSKASAADNGASARSRSVLSERMSVGSSGQLPRNDRTADAPWSGVKRALPRTGLVIRVVAPRKDFLCVGQVELRTVRSQRGPCVTLRTEPVRLAEPAIERTRPGENPSRRPGAGRTITIAVGRRVATVSFQRPVVVVTTSQSPDTVRLTVQSFVSVPVSVTRKAARCGVAASAAPQARRNAAKTAKPPTRRSTVEVLKQTRRASGSFGPSASLNIVAGPERGLGLVLEGFG